MDILYVWFSELNYLMTKHNCENLDDLEDILFWKYAIISEIL